MRFGVGSASVISPTPRLSYSVYNAFPFVSVFGPPALNIGFPQPLGHQIISTGPNSYIYRPVTDLGNYMARALAALRSANYAQAVVELEPVVSESPDDGNAWLLRAQALFGLAEYGKAAEACTWRCASCRARSGAGRSSSGAIIFARPRSTPPGCVRWKVMCRLNPRGGAGHFLLGYHYGYLGHAAEAERELHTALELMTGSNELADALLNTTTAAPARPTSRARLAVGRRNPPGLARPTRVLNEMMNAK